MTAIDAPAFGLGGDACVTAGLERVAALPLGAAGFLDAARRGPAIARAFGVVVRAAPPRRLCAALLVDYTEFNFRRAPKLRELGTKVLWYVAPQVWAWRPSRLSSLPPRIDALAVILPFEEALWKNAGASAEYVGHPATATPVRTRDDVRRELGIAHGARALALLPGSRPAEVHRLLPPMLDAVSRMRVDAPTLEARVLVSRSLDDLTARTAHARAEAAGVSLVLAPEGGAMPLLGGFDASLCASGTASLEAALAGAHPSVSYRTDSLTAAVVGAALRTPFVALPNVILGRPIWPELLQSDANGPRMAAEVRKVLERRARFDDAARELRACLGEERSPANRIASRLRRWLERPLASNAPSAPNAPPPASPRRPDPSSTTSSSR